MIRQDADGGWVQESRTMGATAAMERAEATAIRRASRTRIGAATVSRVCAEPETVNEQDSSFDSSVSKLLQTSERTLLWVAHQLDGLTLPGLSVNKRLRLAAGCLHIAIEHAQAIVVLTQEKCFGSALALQRPLIEAWARGFWLFHAATEEDVDRAEQDKFPPKGEIVKALEAFDTKFPCLGGASWAVLCSYTLTGFEQIEARMSLAGLQSNYTLEHVRRALRCADMFQLASSIVVAEAAGNLPLAQAICDRLGTYAAEDGPRP
ncbi:MAG: hypothetical protein OXL36_09780 [Bryobacterales bacterium]|nr:hypothetical protein [Bryobacterales bacterium]MDE0292801.1 hypothetical protein [Bryobacterales bacterium]